MELEEGADPCRSHRLIYELLDGEPPPQELTEDCADPAPLYSQRSSTLATPRTQNPTRSRCTSPPRASSQSRRWCVTSLPPIFRPADSPFDSARGGIQNHDSGDRSDVVAEKRCQVSQERGLRRCHRDSQPLYELQRCVAVGRKERTQLIPHARLQERSCVPTSMDRFSCAPT